MKKHLVSAVVILACLWGICAICTMVYTHPVFLLVVSLIGFVFLVANEKGFRNGNDIIDRLIERYDEK